MDVIAIHKLHCDHYGHPPAGLMVRHAERPEVKRHSTYNGLTLGGFAAALEAGRSIGGEWRLLHSPVPRCMQTAACFGWGLDLAGGKGHVPVCVPWLGGQLLYSDHDAAMDILFRVGVQRFMLDWRDGRLPSAAVRPMIEVMRDLTLCLSDAMRADRCPVLMVSHDINLLHLTHAAGAVLETHAQPDFLDGVSLDFVASRLRISDWRSGRPSEVLVEC